MAVGPTGGAVVAVGAGGVADGGAVGAAVAIATGADVAISAGGAVVVRDEGLHAERKRARRAGSTRRCPPRPMIRIEALRALDDATAPLGASSRATGPLNRSDVAR